MGTHIHAFVEVDYNARPDHEPFDSGHAGLRPFNAGEFFIWNNYALFDALANARSDGFADSERPTSPRALYPPRGLPDHCTDDVFDAFHLWVIDEKHKHLAPEGPHETVTREEAKAWVKQGVARFVRHRHTYGEMATVVGVSRPDSDYRPTLVTNPDWHHAGWLTLSEVRSALDHFRSGLTQLGREFEVPVEFEAILEAMATFERRLGQGRTRVVFWFDS